MKRLNKLLNNEKGFAQTDIGKKQYQGLDKPFISNKNNKDANASLITKEKKKCNKSSLI